MGNKANDKVDNFKVIYTILKTLERVMDLEEFDFDTITAETLNLTAPRWGRIMQILVNNGYITGVNIRNTLDCNYPKATLVRPEITLKGLEYLQENSTMKKVANALKGVADIVGDFK